MNALIRIIRSLTRDMKYFKNYQCTVAAQSSDWKTLDLVPDDEAIRGDGLKGVPIRHGLPGCRVKVPVGSRVLLGFESGSSTRPFAALWDPGSVEVIVLAEGSQPVARVGDQVSVFWPSSMSITAVTPMGALEGTVSITTPGIGVIESGNEKLLS